MADFKVIMSLPGIDIIAKADGSLGWKKGGGSVSGGGGGKKYNWLDEPECPEHGRWEWVKPGTRRDGSTYKGFWTCSNDDCLNRPGREFTENTDPDDYMAEDGGGNETLDDLPF